HCVRTQKFLRQIFLERHPIAIANKNPDQSLALFAGVGFYFRFADDRRIGTVGERRKAGSTRDVVRPAVITAGYRIGPGTFTAADGKRHAAVRAPIFQCKTFSLMAHEKYFLAEDF